MTTRTKEVVVRFDHPFSIEGIERTLPPGDYRVVTEEEPIDGLSFVAYRRIATTIALPTLCHQSISARADRFASVEIVRIAPADLARAQHRDTQLTEAASQN